MAYIPNATTVTEPVDGQKASSMGLEFRTLKSYIQSVIVAGIAANTAAIAGKVNKSGDTMTGNLALAAAAVTLTLQRTTKASGNTSLVFGGGTSGVDWLIYQSVSQDFLHINNSSLGNIARFLPTGNFKSLYGMEASNFVINDQATADGGLFGFTNANGPRIGAYGTAFGGGVSGHLRFTRPDGSIAAFQDNAGQWSFAATVLASISGSAASASSIPWTGVTGRPTALSQFTNDIGFGAGTLTSFQGRAAAAAVLISADVTGALGYTPYNSSNPSAYTTLAAVAAAGYQTGSGSVASAAVATSVAGGGTVSAATVTATGLVKGNGSGGNGLGTITVSSSAPSGGADGDIWFRV